MYETIVSEPRRLPASFWWVLGSAVLMTVGAFGPWETLLGVVSFSGTELDLGWHVIGAGVAAVVGLGFYVRRRRVWLCLVPLLAGGWSVLLTGGELSDIGNEGGDLEAARWGLYVALVGSCSLVLASFCLAVESTSREPKVRRPWAVFAFSVLTLGLYHLYWYYVTNRELKEFGVGKYPVVSLLAQFPGALLLVPPFVSWWRFYSRIREAQGRAGSPDQVSHAVGITLFAIGIILLPFELVYAQEHLNGIWRSVDEPAPPLDAFPYTADFAPEPRTAPEG